MSAHRLLNNFTGGEISPQLDARIDLQKYETSCRALENMRPLPFGGASFRAGTLFVAAAKFDNKRVRMIPFTLTTAVSYMIEMGDLYMRFYRNGARLGAPYEIATVFTEAELPTVKFRQINSVMYMVHPNHPPQKLSTTSDTSWSIASVSWSYPPLLDQNITATTITPSGTTGAINLVASTPIFNAQHVGAYWEVSYRRDGSGITPLSLAVTGDSGNLQVKGDWSLVTTNYWYGTLKVQRSRDNGSTWETIREFKSQSDRNVNASGTELTDVLLRLSYVNAGSAFASPPWTGTAPANYVAAQAKLESNEVFVNGLVQITAFTSTTQVDATVINTLPATTATIYWAEGAWSPYQGYPACIGLYEQRILYASTTRKPNTIWGSVTADYENFTYGDNDDAAVAYQAASSEQDPINFMVSLNLLICGTPSEEFGLGSGNQEEALTPNNVTIRAQTNHGCEALEPIVIGRAILFVQRQGRRIREFFESNPYSQQVDAAGTDITLLAEHLFTTTATISSIEYGRLPDPQLYLIRSDGTLCVCAYNREQNVTAWSRYVTQGSFESAASLYASPADQVWVSVRRVVGGVTKRFIEVFTTEVADKTNGVYMDAATAYAGAPVNVLGGLGYLEGKVVSVVADGQVIGDTFAGTNTLTVSGGQITLPNSMTASVIRVGLPYYGKLQPMKVDMQMGNGTSQGRKRRITELCVRFLNSLGCTYGNSQTNDVATGRYADVVDFRDETNPMDASPPLFTGDKVLSPWPGNVDLNGDIMISQLQPLPMTVLGLFARWDAFGE